MRPLYYKEFELSSLKFVKPCYDIGLGRLGTWEWNQSFKNSLYVVTQDSLPKNSQHLPVIENFKLKNLPNKTFTVDIWIRKSFKNNQYIFIIVVIANHFEEDAMIYQQTWNMFSNPYPGDLIAPLLCQTCIVRILRHFRYNLGF